MWTAKWILDAYEEGDESLRWEMYMVYRDLRRHFDELEDGPGQQHGRKERASEKKAEKIRWNPCARLVKGKLPV